MPRDYYAEEIEGQKSRDYYEEEVMGKIPPSENVLQRAVNIGGGMAKNAFQRMIQAGPASFNTITGGPQTEFAHGAKTEIFNQLGMPEVVSESLSGATDPQAIMGATLGANTVKQMPGALRKGANWFAEPWQNVSKIQKYKSSGLEDIGRESSEALGQVSKKSSMQKQVVGRMYGDEPLSGLESSERYLEKGIKKSSDVEALNLQKDLPRMYGKKSGQYGEELGNLIGDKPIPVKASEVNPQIENVLLKHGVLRFDEGGKIVPARAPISANESKIYNMYRNFKEGITENPDIEVDASDLLKSKDSMKVRFGKPFSKDDMLMSDVRTHISSVLDDKVKGLKELRSKHAPFLKGKYQSIKELNPFSSEYETGRATKFVERIAKGTASPDEKRLVGFLENELGREIGKEGKSFGNRLQQVPMKAKAIKARLDDELSRVERTLEDAKTAIAQKKSTSTKQLEDIVDEMMRKNNLEKWKRKGIAIGASSIPFVKGFLLRALGWSGSRPE